MGFLDKKEEVMHMELTSYGRHLLSIGKLKPEFYAFYDDDIQYEVSFEQISGTNVLEPQGETKGRIINETPYLRAQSNFVGLENRLSSEETYIEMSDIRYPSSFEKSSYLHYPLGTCDPLAGTSTPAWSVTYLHGDALSGSNRTHYGVSRTLDVAASGNKQTGAGLPYKNIPQVNMNLDYTLSVRSIYMDEDEQADVTSPNIPQSEIKPDGTYISVKEQQILLYFLEQNGFKYSDAFKVEVFLYDELDPSDNTLIPLEFLSQVEPEITIKNDILIDGTIDYETLQEGATFNAADEDPNYVEYFFDLRVDRQIPEEDVCSGILKLKKKDIYVDLEFDCIEREFASDIDIYNTGIVEADIEDCD